MLFNSSRIFRSDNPCSASAPSHRRLSPRRAESLAERQTACFNALASMTGAGRLRVREAGGGAEQFRKQQGYRLVVRLPGEAAEVDARETAWIALVVVADDPSRKAVEQGIEVALTWQLASASPRIQVGDQPLLPFPGRDRGRVHTPHAVGHAAPVRELPRPEESRVEAAGRNRLPRVHPAPASDIGPSVVGIWNVDEIAAAEVVERVIHSVEHEEVVVH